MRKPRVLIVRPYDTRYPYAGELPFAEGIPRSSNTAAENLLANLAVTGNKGNMAIGEALGRIFAVDRQHSTYLDLSGLLAAGWDAGRIGDAIQRNFDLVILGMTNNLRLNFDFAPLAEIVAHLNTPLVVLGLGLQSELPAQKSAFPAATWRFLDIANRSAAIFGVRGRETREWLHALGYTNAQVLGCPSFYLYPENFLAVKPPMPSPFTTPITAGHLNLAQSRSRVLCALFQDTPSHYVVQSEIKYLVKYTDTKTWLIDDATGRLNSTLCRRAFADRIGMVPPFARYWMFQNMDAWRVFCAQGAYFLGDRLHGGIVALQAGVPAIILWNDLRVRELTEFCGLPNLEITKIGAGRPGDLVDSLLNATKLAEFKDIYRLRLAQFDAALSQCGLDRDVERPLKKGLGARAGIFGQVAALIARETDVTIPTLEAKSVINPRWLRQRMGHQRMRALAARATLTRLHLRANPAWLRHIIRRRVDGSRLVVVVGSAHRVGSTWLFNMLRDLGCLRNAIHEVPADLHGYGALRPGAIGYGWLAGVHGWAIIKGHADPPTAAEAGLARFVTIQRDPRDVLVSASFYRARQPVAQGGWGDEFRALSPAARIERLLLDPNPTLLTELKHWYRTPHAIQVRYETLHANPAATLAGLADALALPVNRRQVDAVVTRHAFARVTGRAPGQEADAVARKGIVGDWRTYFTDATVACFCTAQNGRWNSLLEEMGYDW